MGMKRKIELAAFMGVFALTGCASAPSAKESYGPSGKTSYEISCNNMSASLGPCYQKAGEMCKERGYNVVSQHSDAPFASIIAECK